MATVDNRLGARCLLPQIGGALDRAEGAQALVDEFDAGLALAATEAAAPGTGSIIGLFPIDDIRIYREHNLYGC